MAINLDDDEQSKTRKKFGGLIQPDKLRMFTDISRQSRGKALANKNPSVGYETGNRKAATGITQPSPPKQSTSTGLTIPSPPKRSTSTGVTQPSPPRRQAATGVTKPSPEQTGPRDRPPEGPKHRPTTDSAGPKARPSAAPKHKAKAAPAAPKTVKGAEVIAAARAALPKKTENLQQKLAKERMLKAARKG